ncbi:unnamed protein product [Linum trigynum]|uniref:Pectinesterase inhibitor domain-containing protein n=1 Tax=Linum trigynum TaxID=586398 RepID=A0AAV2GBG7_9ROSI
MDCTSISTFLLVLITITTCHQAHAQEAPQAAPGPSTSTSASATGPTMTKPELLAKACDNTPLTKDLCRSFLASFPESEVKDIHALAKFAIKMTSLNASKTHDQIETMEHNPATDDVTKQRLNDCAENYQDAIDQLEDSMPALDSKVYDDVITFITAAVQDVESCEDGFKEPPAVKSPMTETNQVFTQLCNICLSITNMCGK